MGRGMNIVWLMVALGLAACGKPLARSTESAGGGANYIPNPAIAGGPVTCSLTLGTPTFASVPLTISVTGQVDRLFIDGTAVATPVAPATSVTRNYPYSSPGNKTVNVRVEGAFNAYNTCSASFVAPDLSTARAASFPPDNNTNYQFAKTTSGKDTNGTQYRYVFAIHRQNGQGYYNSISLDARFKPGVLDAWTGWKKIPGQDGYTNREPLFFALGNSVYLGAYNVKEGGYYATAGTCLSENCFFSPWQPVR